MADNYIKDVLKDVLRHTHDLSIFEMVPPLRASLMNAFLIDVKCLSGVSYKMSSRNRLMKEFFKQVRGIVRG